MDMQKKTVELLKLMPASKNILDEPIFYRAGFYDFQEKLNLDKGAYEDLMKSLYHQNLIKIDMNGWNKFDGAIVTLTSLGYEYRLNASKQKIGFSAGE